MANALEQPRYAKRQNPPRSARRLATSPPPPFLQLVHAQLRERLEDTQVKLEHKSQSAARRWLASAQRLAQEFARPDRQSLMSLSPKPRSRTPKAVDSNDGNSRNTERRSKSPARLHRVSSAGATIDFNKTL